MGHRVATGIGGVLAGGLLLLPVASTAERPRFSVGTAIPIEAGDPGPQAIAVDDLNEDGRPDIVVVAPDEEDGPIAVLINQGNGAFGAPTLVSDEDVALSFPVAVAIADVGSAIGGPDGNNDIIAIDEDGGFLVLFGDGAGNFSIETDLVEIEGLDTPEGVAVGDFDGKNGPDLAIIDDEGDNGGQVFFLCNVGQAGLFEPCATIAFDSGGDTPIDVGTGDFNGDGHADVVVLNQGLASDEGNLALFVGNGDGSFTRPGQPTFFVANEPRDLVVTNLNPGQDAIDDVAVGEFEILGNDNVTILLGRTSGSVFTRPNKALLEIATTSIAVGNFAGNDSPDLAGTNDPSIGVSSLTVAAGDGTGLFESPGQGGVILGGGLSLKVGRFNDDDLDDLVVLNLDANEVRIALNTFDPSTPTPTATAVPEPTETPTREPSPSPTSTPPATQTATRTWTATATAADDDSCSIATHDSASRSWLPWIVAAVAIVARRRTRRP